MFFSKKNKIESSDFFPENFVDIHSHLLPGIDDGAKNLEHSLELIKKMYALGIKNFITTPHVLGDVYPNSSKIIKDKLTEVQEELVKQNMSEITITAAAEYMIDEQFSKLLEMGDLLTLKDNLVLVEMSYFSAPINLYDILFEIQLKGYKPILAHPERYNFYHNDFESYYKLKKAGCLFQLNFLSMTEQYGKNVQKVCRKLLKLNMYDFVGSDTHHSNHLKLLAMLSTNRKNLKHLELLMKKNVQFI